MNDVKKVESEALTLVDQAKGINVLSNDDNKRASLFLQQIKLMMGRVRETFDPIVEKAYEAHKEAVAQRSKFLKPLENAEMIIKTRIKFFIEDQEKRRREQEEKLRREAEAKQKELEAKAEAARANGDEKKAERYEDKAASVVAPTLASTVEKVAGVSYSERWYAEVVDFALVPLEYMVVDMVKLNKLAKAVHDSVKVPGVVFKCEKVVSSRSYMPEVE